MIGRSVLIGGSSATLASSGISGAVEAQSSGDVVVQVRNAAGVLVRTLDLGQQPAGRAAFNWDGKDASGNALPAGGSYSLSAQVVNGASSVAAGTDIAARVASVSMGSGGLTLNLSSGDSVPFTSVLQLY
jgi:flagellar basal-body rod modification protein FlgD